MERRCGISTDRLGWISLRHSSLVISVKVGGRFAGNTELTGISEVELIKWNKAIGDDIEEMETVCTVQSDKSAVDITSRYTGIVKKLYVDAGEMIKIGAPLMDIETEEEATVTHSGGSAKTGAPSQEKASQPPPPRFQRTTAVSRISHIMTIYRID